MTKYAKVRDLLEAARRFHGQLEIIYLRLADSTSKQRVQLLLNTICRHERYLEQGLADYEEKGDPRLLDTWMQYAPDQDALQPPSVDEPGEAMDLEDVEQKVRRLDRDLAEFYKEAADRAEPEEVRRLFRNLAEQQEEEEATVRKCASALKHNA